MAGAIDAVQEPALVKGVLRGLIRAAGPDLTWGPLLAVLLLAALLAWWR